MLIRWIAIYPVDSAIQRLNNRGQKREARGRSVEREIRVTGKGAYLGLLAPPEKRENKITHVLQARFISINCSTD